MVEVLKFVMSDFLTFMGTLILINLCGFWLAETVARIIPRNKQ